MSDLGHPTPPPPGPAPAVPPVPPVRRGLQVAAAVCLAVPVVALLAVPTYARETPELGGFPFFVWYQFAWVFGCAALTWTAHRLVLASRPARPAVPTAGAGEGER